MKRSFFQIKRYDYIVLFMLTAGALCLYSIETMISLFLYTFEKMYRFMQCTIYSPALYLLYYASFALRFTRANVLSQFYMLHALQFWIVNSPFAHRMTNVTYTEACYMKLMIFQKVQRNNNWCVITRFITHLLHILTEMKILFQTAICFVKHREKLKCRAQITKMIFCVSF